MKFEGTWLIYEMELWDEDYLNMEVKAFSPWGQFHIFGKEKNEREIR